MSSDDIKQIEEVANAREALSSVKQEEPEEQIEPVEQNHIINETKEETNNTIEENKEEAITSKTARLAEKKITCPKCNKCMNLRSYRYKHEKNCQGNLEDRPIKAQSKPKAKVKAVAIKTPQNEVIEETEPTYLKEVKQKIIKEPTQPVIKSPQEQIYDNYKILQQEYMDKKKEKAYNLFLNMITGSHRKKKR